MQGWPIPVVMLASTWQLIDVRPPCAEVFSRSCQVLIMYVCVRACVYIYVCTYVSLYIFIYAYTYFYMHVYIYVRSKSALFQKVVVACRPRQSRHNP